MENCGGGGLENAEAKEKVLNMVRLLVLQSLSETQLQLSIGSERD